MRRIATLALLSAVCTHSTARADDDDLHLMRETTSYTAVPDAGDPDDPFDLNVRVAFTNTRFETTIQREQENAAGRAAWYDVGSYRHTRSTLDLGLEVGIYHDLAAFVRLPVVLDDSQRISAGADAAQTGGLFTLPFRSPTRSGIDSLGVGMLWAPLNQNRVHEVPTWLILVEATLPVGSLLHACDASTSCSNAGVNRGTTALRLETRLSRRFRVVETYFGLGARVELPTDAKKAFRPGGNLVGYQRTMPPVLGELTLGAAFVPWENLGAFQRFTIDARLSAQYFSSGRDYSPLFDALGSSLDPSLQNVTCENMALPDASGQCAGGFAAVPFNGLTDVEAYGRIGGRLALEIQPARYVSFSLGTSIFYETGHGITESDPCNAGVNTDAHPELIGQCMAGGVATGVFNPHYRESINLPGNRFRVDGGLVLSFFASATAQF